LWPWASKPSNNDWFYEILAKSKHHCYDLGLAPILFFFELPLLLHHSHYLTLVLTLPCLPCLFHPYQA
jgi:hypothetical protein